MHLLPARVSEAAPSSVEQSPTTLSAAAAVMPASTAGVIYIEFAKIHLRIENGADTALLRVVLETLQR